MGWQARLPKDQKLKFERTCNKCGGTGIKKKYISVAGVKTTKVVKCKCSVETESTSTNVIQESAIET